MFGSLILNHVPSPGRKRRCDGESASSYKAAFATFALFCLGSCSPAAGPRRAGCRPSASSSVDQRIPALVWPTCST
ncbi:hypothetical protein LX32DRAFT_642868 [Colletotrichum zoysiae]|uniref:Uncharacterized protein n=1 Tax=Colletotrichum zoysiae TaxID=1216348 RepID=A0AAD9HC81_9PEZI|nr:hypothetical protein LX32DRAFT_642868 [Colletotrichum zoysiae]